MGESGWRTLGTAVVAASLLVSVTACGTQPTKTAAATRAATSQSGTASDLAVTKALRDLEASYQGRIGAYAFDTSTGRAVGYRAHERFPLMSTFKSLAAGAVLHKARTSDPGLMDRVVRWTSDELQPYSPITEQHVDTGLTVAQLCDAAIRYSDNTAGNMLLKQLGGPSGLTRYLRSLGDPVSRLDHWEIELNDWKPGDRRDTTTPANYAADLRALTVGNRLAAPDRGRLIGWLKNNTTGDARIRAGLPNWTVGDKTGSDGSKANDVAIAWPPGSSAPVIISIFTYRHDLTAPRDDKILADTAAILARGLGHTP